jgi:hypothetical protein
MLQESLKVFFLHRSMSNVQTKESWKLLQSGGHWLLRVSNFTSHIALFYIPQSQPPQEQISLLPGRVQSGDVEGVLTLVACRQTSSLVPPITLLGEHGDSDPGLYFLHSSAGRGFWSASLVEGSATRAWYNDL